MVSMISNVNSLIGNHTKLLMDLEVLVLLQIKHPYSIAIKELGWLY